MKFNSRNRALQICLFATGCSGIVAEFVLSTLATYLIGNATFQWTMIMSIMLFAMGLGSRFSRYFKDNLFDTFVFVEFMLSCLCALSAVISFGLSVQIESNEIVIYPLSFFIGTLIGLEIPIVTRLNSEYEELRANISSVLEMDYFGSLLGGVAFAFLFLPYLGFSFTPVLLGSINFLVASWLLWSFFDLARFKKSLIFSFAICLAVIGCAAFFAKDMILFSEQKKYKDTIIYSKQTRYQKIVMTRWKKYYWLYINGQEQFSTYDEEKYHEPLVHPAMKIASSHSDILILGGGDGLAAREIFKYNDVKSLTLVDLDPVMTDLAKNYPVLRKINLRSMSDKRIKIINMDGSAFLNKTKRLFNVVFIDLPDPDSMDLMHLYSYSLYENIRKHLARGGVLVTQATSPFFANKAFLCINKTMKAAGFSTLPYHNQVPTLGEWGWVLGVNKNDLTKEKLRNIALHLKFNDIKTRYLNHDAMISMIYFGKETFNKKTVDKISINTEADPVLYRYYQQGSWGVY